MYSPDLMEYDSNDRSPSTISVQSPATVAAQMDTQFVAKHNVTAEIYQLFKDDVDLIFSGKVVIQDQPALLVVRIPLYS